MPKVYLSPAYHYFNRCAISGCDETTHNNLYMDELEPYLTACGIDWKRGPRRTPKSDEDGDALMIQAVRESDAWGADVHYISHTNAYDGTVSGCRPMIYTGSERGEKLAEIMIKHRKAVTGQKVTLFRRQDLYELRVPAAVSYYEEHVFHDNAADAQWFHSNLRLIAEAAARGLCEYLGVKFVDPYAEKKPETPAATGVTVNIPIVRNGSTGDAARAAMVLLKDQGYYTDWLSDTDDLFGPIAEAATEAFQKAHGLDVDGVIGQQTWPVLLGA